MGYRDIPTIVSAADLRARDLDPALVAAVRTGKARYVGAIDQGDAERLLSRRLATYRYATDPDLRRPIRRS